MRDRSPGRRAVLISVLLALATGTFPSPGTAGVSSGPDVYPASLSYGNGDVWGAMVIHQGDGRAAWVVAVGTYLDLGTYVRNKGTAASASNTKVRFCINVTEACLQTTDYDPFLQSGRLAPDITVGTLSPGAQTFKYRKLFQPPRLGLHVISACVFNAGEASDATPNSCTHLFLTVVPQIPNGSYRSSLICQQTCANGDLYGTTSFNPNEEDLPVADLIDDVQGPPAGTPECSDGLDNDNDGLVDALDPGCSSSSDSNERHPVRPLCPGDVVRTCYANAGRP